MVSFIFLFRGLGFAYNEVVVSMLKDKKVSFADLRRFAWLLSFMLTVFLALIAFTPLAKLYFNNVAGLKPSLAALAIPAFVLCVLWQALSVFSNLYQGVIVFAGQTRYVSESVTISVVVTAVLLLLGVVLKTYPGLIVGVIAFVAGNVSQLVWLLWRSYGIRTRLGQKLNPLSAS